MTSENTSTTFEAKCDILGELWIYYRDSQEFAEFIAFNDIGLPLAYAVANQLATLEPTGVRLVEDSFVMLMTGLDYQEDLGWSDLNEMLEG
jgi:hypothetical protein